MLKIFSESILEPYGEDAAMMALRKWQVDPTSRRDWPTIKDLLLILSPPISTRDEANELAGKMLVAIGRRGQNWGRHKTYRYDGHADFKTAMLAEFGETGEAVVRREGGWERFCDAFDSGLNPNARPQLRDLCEANVKRFVIEETRLQIAASQTKQLGDGR